MSYDVVVVGGGIGGLTVAALLAARGMSVCLLERQSQVGGCVSRVQFGGLDFEPGIRLYSDWGPGEIHQQIFSELKTVPPRVTRLENEVVVRIVDEDDVALNQNSEAFFAELRRVFPESARETVEFYQEVGRAAAVSLKHLARSQDQRNNGLMRTIRNWLLPTERTLEQSVGYYLRNTSPRFRTFIDAQLRAFANSSAEQSSFLLGSKVLDAPRTALYSIEGGPSAVAESLSASITNSGGRVRLDTPVLRLAYDQSGKATGVELLSGETILARRAIISNMTIWDTYGKLIGLNRTPREVKKVLNALQSDGAFLIYAIMEETAARRLPSEMMLVLTAKAKQADEHEPSEFTLATGASSSDRRAVTIKARTDVAEWFRYQSSEADYEEWDQQALERLWESLHGALPELGADIEILETANPRTFYEQTRRKLGMVLGLGRLEPVFTQPRFQTILPNVFMVGDTVSVFPTLASVSESALAVADLLTQ